MSVLTRKDLLHLQQGIEFLLAELGGQDDSLDYANIASAKRGGFMRSARQSCSGYTLPNTLRLKELIRSRSLRRKFFDESLFFDPCWEMLLQLLLAEVQDEQISVSSLCYVSGSPPTTALRHLNVLVECGLVSRKEDPGDRRRTIVALTDRALQAMSRYFEQVDG